MSIDEMKPVLIGCLSGDAHDDYYRLASILWNANSKNWDPKVLPPNLALVIMVFLAISADTDSKPESRE